MILKAKDFNTRAALEEYITSRPEFHDTMANAKDGHKIQGTFDELKKLFLSDSSTVFGFRCEITDFPIHNFPTEADRLSAYEKDLEKSKKKK